MKYDKFTDAVLMSLNEHLIEAQKAKKFKNVKLEEILEISEKVREPLSRAIEKQITEIIEPNIEKFNGMGIFTKAIITTLMEKKVNPEITTLLSTEYLSKDYNILGDKVKGKWIPSEAFKNEATGKIDKYDLYHKYESYFAKDKQEGMTK